MARKKGGRPPKNEQDKLSYAINLKLTKDDYTTIQKRAEKITLSPTQYARIMTLKGEVKSRFTIEELNLMRKMSGIANNVNQIAKLLNAGYEFSKKDAVAIVLELKQMIHDSKKH